MMNDAALDAKKQTSPATSSGLSIHFICLSTLESFLALDNQHWKMSVGLYRRSEERRLGSPQRNLFLLCRAGHESSNNRQYSHQHHKCGNGINEYQSREERYHEDQNAQPKVQHS